MSSAPPPEHSDIQPPAEPAEPPDHAHTCALPTVLCFVGTYLKPEMWHVYNQITGLRKFRSIVLTRLRENPHLFPEPQVEIFRHTPLPWWEKFHLKYIARAPREIYKGYKQSLQRSFDATRPDLLHIYFGHEATRLARTLAHFDIPWLVSFHGADLGRYVLRPRRPHPTPARLPERPPHPGPLPNTSSPASLNSAALKKKSASTAPTSAPNSSPTPNATGHLLMAPGSGAKPPASCPKKGLTDTIQAFHLFHQKHPRAHLHLAGDGPQRPEIEHRIRHLRLSDHVTLHGMLDRAALNALFARSHIFLHPSITDTDGDMEGVPNSLLEAMSTGLVCVGTRHAGHPRSARRRRKRSARFGKRTSHYRRASARPCRQPGKNAGLLLPRRRAYPRPTTPPEHQITLLEDCYNQALGNNL
jgi:colanic acid/amylovoran biosynthesis glycosyltransferase